MITDERYKGVLSMALKPISKIAAGVQASTTLAIDSLFKQMKAEGKDVVGFGAGEPDFPTPEHIKQAGIEAIENNQTKYTPAAGLMDLRKAACYRLKEDCGLDYEPTQIVVASGAKHSVYIALMTLCNPGDEVVIAAPYWVSYSEMVKQAGAIPVIVAATEEADFKITAEQLDAAITDKTKVFMLNSPSNPTGMVYTKAELEAIAEVCCRHNICHFVGVVGSAFIYHLYREASRLVQAGNHLFGVIIYLHHCVASIKKLCTGDKPNLKILKCLNHNFSF